MERGTLLEVAGRDWGQRSIRDTRLAQWGELTCGNKSDRSQKEGTHVKDCRFMGRRSEGKDR